jgi:Spy/CpxP family protein refolding chaperone
MLHPNHARMQTMNLMRKSMTAALLAACCASTFAAGQAEAPPDAGQPAGHGPDRSFDHGRNHGRGHFLGGLQLSEAQQDKLFAIEHAAAPQRRQQGKAIRRAHEAMADVREAAQFDEAKANAASRELGQAVAAEALLEARVHAQVLALLTPEQREQLRQRRPQPPRERP